MKPHEEEWKTDRSTYKLGEIRINDAVSIRVTVAPWRVPEGDAKAEEMVREVEALVLAAPLIAQTLLETLSDGGHVPGCPSVLNPLAPCGPTCARFRATLAKAGVLP